MTLLFPWALLGLLGLPLLVLLERWRRRPRPRSWPSLLLWREVAEAAGPTRRRLSLLLLLECAALFLLSLAAAEPVVTAGRGAPRGLAFVDTGPHMHARRADGTTALEATLRELDRIDISLRRIEVPGGDLARRAAAAAEAEPVVVATSRPEVVGRRFLVLGRAPDGSNLGIDAIEVSGDRLWFAVATDGEARDVRVRIGREERTVATGRGVWTAFAPSIAILTEDNYDGDDRIALRRPGLTARDDTGSRRVGAALFSAGTPATRAEGDADLVITAAGGEPRPGPVLGLDCIAGPGIFDGLFLDDCRWPEVRTRPGAGLLTIGSGALARWLDEDTLWLGLPTRLEWDEHGTLAVLIERAKRERMRALLSPGESLVGDAVASPAPGLVFTRGVDRPWNGSLPAGGGVSRDAWRLRPILALLAAAVLALYLRAMLSRRS